MHEVKVDVFQAKALECLVQTLFRLPMICAPQLGCHEDVLAFDTSVECFLQTLTDFGLVLVYQSGYSTTLVIETGAHDQDADISPSM